MVIDSRQEDDTVRRRRECEKCGKRFTSFERPEILDLYVIKKDGRRERFDRAKLRGGIVKACEKRPVSVEKMEDVVTQVERLIQKKNDREVLASKIGELVMEKLKFIDDVAYVRFASVYRQFKDVGQFMVELKDILGKDKKKK